jgi:hypothetical protein
MDKKVELLESGNNLIFDVPEELRHEIGSQYTVSVRDDGSVLYTPVNVKHENIFNTAAFKGRDFRAIRENDPELCEVKPVGKEIID